MKLRKGDVFGGIHADLGKMTTGAIGIIVGSAVVSHIGNFLKGR